MLPSPMTSFRCQKASELYGIEQSFSLPASWGQKTLVSSAFCLFVSFLDSKFSLYGYKTNSGSLSNIRRKNLAFYNSKQLLMDTKPTGQKERPLLPTQSFSEVGRVRERKEVIRSSTPEELLTPHQQKASSRTHHNQVLFHSPGVKAQNAYPQGLLPFPLHSCPDSEEDPQGRAVSSCMHMYTYRHVNTHTPCKLKIHRTWSGYSLRI